MKKQAIVFTEHAPETLDHLIAQAKKRGQILHRGSDFLKFSAHEGIHAIPAPKARKTVYGTMETEAAVPSLLERINILDYLPEGN